MSFDFLYSKKKILEIVVLAKNKKKNVLRTRKKTFYLQRCIRYSGLGIKLSQHSLNHITQQSPRHNTQHSKIFAD
jgi:hypothetical protein